MFTSLVICQVWESFWDGTILRCNSKIIVFFARYINKSTTPSVVLSAYLLSCHQLPQYQMPGNPAGSVPCPKSWKQEKMLLDKISGLYYDVFQQIFTLIVPRCVCLGSHWELNTFNLQVGAGSFNDKKVTGDHCLEMVTDLLLSCLSDISIAWGDSID